MVVELHEILQPQVKIIQSAKTLHSLNLKITIATCINKYITNQKESLRDKSPTKLYDKNQIHGQDQSKGEGFLAVRQITSIIENNNNKHYKVGVF